MAAIFGQVILAAVGIFLVGKFLLGHALYQALIAPTIFVLFGGIMLYRYRRFLIVDASNENDVAR